MAKCACGASYDLNDWSAGDIPTIMAEEGQCFDCAFWTEKVRMASDPATARLVVRVDGTHYCIEENDTGFKGFGGREFKIAFNDGRKVVSRNLWCQGDIPAHFRDRLPNNAQFI